MPLGEGNSFFNFRMVDRNANEINLSTFHDKDVIVVINCITTQEVDELAPLYYKLEDSYGENVQILCLPGNRFFYDVKGKESRRLIDYLKEKSHCNIEDEDGLTFILNNKEHKPNKETFSCVGNNLRQKELSGEISKVLN